MIYKVKGIISLVILLTIFSGCVSREENVTSTSTVIITTVPTSQSVEFKTISKGYYSSYTRKANLLVNDEEEWASLWVRVKGTTSPTPPVPDVDFSKQSVVAVFMGEKNTGGYDITIQKIERDGVTKVYLTKKYPLPGDMVTQALTQPYHIVMTEKLDDVEFVEEIVGKPSRASIGECSSDKDCLTTGCSGQLCSSRKVVTTCEWMPEYECYRRAKCSCVDGSCQWVKGLEFNRCLEEKAGEAF